ARRGAPLDRAHIIARDILAERVELGALTALQQHRTAVQFAQTGDAGREMASTGERREYADSGRYVMVALTSGKPQRAERTDRHRPGLAVAPSSRLQPGLVLAAFACR